MKNFLSWCLLGILSHGILSENSQGNSDETWLLEVAKKRLKIDSVLMPDFVASGPSDRMYILSLKKILARELSKMKPEVILAIHTEAMELDPMILRLKVSQSDVGLQKLEYVLLKNTDNCSLKPGQTMVVQGQRWYQAFCLDPLVDLTFDSNESTRIEIRVYDHKGLELDQKLQQEWFAWIQNLLEERAVNELKPLYFGSSRLGFD
jgi:hypothetical protein